MFAEAVHESSHAIVGMHFGRVVSEVVLFDDGGGICRFVPIAGDSPATVSLTTKGNVSPRIVPVGSQGLLRDFTPLQIRESRLRCGWTDVSMFNDVVMSMAGRIAHALVTSDDDVFDRASGDLANEQETLAALAIVHPRPWLLVPRAKNIAESIVRCEWSRILSLASHLVARRRLNGAEVRDLVANAANTSAA